MRLPRYIKARSRVSELRSAQQSMISPAEAANVEMAKAGAIAAGAKTIGDAFATVGEVRQKASDAEDDVTFKVNESNLTADLKRIESDPNLDKEVQDDGTPTPEYYMKLVDDAFINYKKGVDNIKNPVLKKRAEAAMRMRENETRVDVEANAGVIEARVAGNKLFTGFINALKNEDIDGAYDLIQTGIDRQLLTPEKAEKWRNEADAAAVDIQVAGLVADVNAGFSISEEEGQARLNELIKDTDLPPEIRDKAIDGSEEKATEWGKVRAKEQEQEEVNAILNYGDDSIRAGNGDLSLEEIDAGFNSNRYGRGKGAAARRNQLYASVNSAITRKEQQMDVGASIRDGQFITNDKKSRTALSDYEASATEGMKDDEAIRTIADISRIAGTVSTRTEKILYLAGIDKASAAQVLPLYQELTANPDRHPDMHLTPESKAFLEDASTLMEAGLARAEAVEVAWGNKNITETQKTERSIQWKEQGIEAATDGFKSLVDSDWYEEPGIGNIDEPPAQMSVEYGAVFKSVYEQTGNMVAAKNLADQSMKKNWVMTNFNSADPDEYTVVKYGLPGDSRQIRRSVIAELENETFRIRQSDGSYKNQKINGEKVTFQTFDNDQEAYDENGNQRFKVFQDGVPLTRITDNGIEVATFVVDKSKIDEFNKASQERNQMSERIKEIEKEERRIQAMTERDKIAPVGPMFTSTSNKRKERLSKLGQEKKKLQESLPATVHF